MVLAVVFVAVVGTRCVRGGWKEPRGGPTLKGGTGRKVAAAATGGTNEGSMRAFHV